MTSKPLFPNLCVSKAERIRLQRDLTSWATLNAIFQANMSLAYLRKLITVEHEGANRAHLLRRLVGRLHTTERKQLYKKLGL